MNFPGHIILIGSGSVPFAWANVFSLFGAAVRKHPTIKLFEAQSKIVRNQKHDATTLICLVDSDTQGRSPIWRDLSRLRFDMHVRLPVLLFSTNLHHERFQRWKLLFPEDSQKSAQVSLPMITTLSAVLNAISRLNGYGPVTFLSLLEKNSSTKPIVRDCLATYERLKASPSVASKPEQLAAVLIAKLDPIANLLWCSKKDTDGTGDHVWCNLLSAFKPFASRASAPSRTAVSRKRAELRKRLDELVKKLTLWDSSIE